MVAAPGVLTNDSDVEGSSLTAVLVAGPANGNVTLNANGSFNYRPRFDFNGTDSFTYRARDGALESNIATVTITVNPVNDAPRPTPVIRRVTINEDTATGGTLTAVDPEGDPFTFSTPPELRPSTGRLSSTRTGPGPTPRPPTTTGRTSLVTASPTRTAPRAFGAVEITVTPVNDAPTAVNDAYSVDEDGTLVLTATRSPGCGWSASRATSSARGCLRLHPGHRGLLGSNELRQRRRGLGRPAGVGRAAGP